MPGVPAGRAIRGTEFLVAFEIDVTLKALAERKDVAELLPDAEHLRKEASKNLLNVVAPRNMFHSWGADKDYPTRYHAGAKSACKCASRGMRFVGLNQMLAGCDIRASGQINRKIQAIFRGAIQSHE
jgi:hypothetical protein